jgi:hypothetical protein
LGLVQALDTSQANATHSANTAIIPTMGPIAHLGLFALSSAQQQIVLKLHGRHLEVLSPFSD